MFTYKTTVTSVDVSPDTMLNDNGAQGWRLVSSHVIDLEVRWVFVKEVAATAGPSVGAKASL